jgi:hypothetical protein
MEHSFETQILDNGRPVDTDAGKFEAGTLLRTSVPKARPLAELIQRLLSVGCRGIRSVVVHPNPVYLHPAHFWFICFF